MTEDNSKCFCDCCQKRATAKKYHRQIAGQWQFLCAACTAAYSEAMPQRDNDLKTKPATTVNTKEHISIQLAQQLFQVADKFNFELPKAAAAWATFGDGDSGKTDHTLSICDSSTDYSEQVLPAYTATELAELMRDNFKVVDFRISTMHTGATVQGANYNAEVCWLSWTELIEGNQIAATFPDLLCSILIKKIKFNR